MLKSLTGGAYMAAAHRARGNDLKPDERGPPVSLSLSFTDRKSTRLNSSHSGESRMPSSA